jgi:predicted AlkP superfamily phosphohydrolase/phosphomutase
MSRYFPKPLQEKLLADRFRNGTDWSRTTVFATPSLYTGFFFVNVAGREPLGTVEPGAAYEEVLGRLEADLWSLADPETGKPAVRTVTRVARHFGLDGPPKALPDLIVEWRPSRRFLARAAHPKGEITQRKPAYFRDCHHLFDGFFAAAGPSVTARGDRGEAALLDMAPSFLRLLGREIPGEMAGRPVEGLS